MVGPLHLNIHLVLPGHVLVLQLQRTNLLDADHGTCIHSHLPFPFVSEKDGPARPHAAHKGGTGTMGLVSQVGHQLGGRQLGWEVDEMVALGQEGGLEGVRLGCWKERRAVVSK